VEVEISTMVAAMATVATKGRLEILEAKPLVARIGGPEGVIGLEVFESGPGEIAVVDLFVPIAAVSTTASIDAWMARATMKLFNVHVGARELEGMTFVEARSTIVADGLSVEVLERCLGLLVVGARIAAGELNEILDPSAIALGLCAQVGTDQPCVTPPAPATPSRATGSGAPRVLTAGYL